MVVTPVGSPGAAVPPPQPHPVDPELPVELSWSASRNPQFRAGGNEGRYQLGIHSTHSHADPYTNAHPGSAGSEPTAYTHAYTYTDTHLPVSGIIFAGLGGGTPIASSEPLRSVDPRKQSDG